MLVKDWMSSPVITIEENENILQAVHLMKKHKIRHLPVVKNGKLTGIITKTDINKVFPSKVTPLDIHELYSFLADIKIKEIMSKNPITIKPENSIEYAAVIMLENKISVLPVTENEYVVGIITDTDIFKFLVEMSGCYKNPYIICVKLEKSDDIFYFLELLKTFKIIFNKIVLLEDFFEKNVSIISLKHYTKNEKQIELFLKEIKNKFEILYILKEDFSKIPHKEEEHEDDLMLF